MRPERLELEGFGTYRERTVVDFVGADLFALTGPTGAGKSTVIDAICFSLYGNVPRLADERMVAPVISQGGLEARVAFDFSVDGHGYRAVRVVRATGRGGATTKEARLVRRADDEVLAGTADELTDAVTDLLGLSWAHFTTCVVLPQGEFMRFLHEKPNKRQDLLVELLDLRLYGAMREAARLRGAAAAAHVEVAERRLADCAFATPEARRAAAERVASFGDLLAVVDRAQERLDELFAQLQEREPEANRRRDDVGRLAAVRVPDDVAALAARRAAAHDARERARRVDDAAVTALVAAEAAREALGDRARLDELAEAHRDRSTLEERLAKGTTVVAERRADHDAARAALDAAVVRRDAAVAAVDAARRADRAGELALTLVAGEACPVCAQVVHEVPAPSVGAGASALRSAAAEQAEAEAVVAEATPLAAAAGAALVAAEALHDDLRSQLATVTARLGDVADAEAVARTLADVEAAEAALADARRAATAAAAARRAADDAFEVAVAGERDARAEFTSARDALAGLDPPVPGGDDLAADWDALRAWASAALPGAEVRAAAAEAARDELLTEQQRLTAEVLAACRAAGFDAHQPGRQVASALHEAEGEVARIDEAVARAAELTAERDAAAVDQQLAVALVGHLNANRFEKWVLEEALHRLVTRATVILGELSGGTYSLTLDAKGTTFSVIDHVNADAVRSARTLSGGETFLASLALALALADEVAELASGGAARLESLFLDEGFGTLDADTLDVVAGALEELQAGGRMVGLISHVPELAERMPCRFVVRKEPGGSVIERVEA